MKEMLKNKFIIAFIIFVLGITYIGASSEKKLEENSRSVVDEIVMTNLK